MYAFKITGGKQLSGDVNIKAAKNAVLPLMICTLLTDEPIVLHNVSLLADVKTLMQLLESLGTEIKVEDGTMTLQTKEIKTCVASYEYISKMRAGFWVLGPLLTRLGKAEVSLPGGCAIGGRLLDIYQTALTAMGAKIDTEHGYIKASGQLHGADVSCWRVTVGGTHNTIMAASLAKGTTVIHNAALEPEVMDLIQMLSQMGAKFEGVGTRTLTIHGVDKLHGTEYTPVPDRIETVTFMTAAALTQSHLFLKNARVDLMESALPPFVMSQVKIAQKENGVDVDARQANLVSMNMTTGAYPDFPTDDQPLMCALMSLSKGECLINETMHDNRFMHVAELVRMGANIRLIDNTHALINGVEKLKGATVMASDLRGGAALVVAALAADGYTTVQRVYHIDRGYHHLEEKLQKVGASIERLWLE